MFENYKDHTILVACSGGPDSMALLDMCVRDNLDIVVAHVNYQRRESAKRDELIVLDYCEKHNLTCKVLYPEYTSGNFQKWARVVRYRFFKELCEEYKCNVVFVGHHADDVLETYLFQTQRNSTPSYYGIKKTTIVEGCNLYRPLLRLYKEELFNYCEKYNIEYGIDESNLKPTYTRNKIRSDIINKMSLDDKKELFYEIKQKNLELGITKEMVNIVIDSFQSRIDYLWYSKLNDFEKTIFLHEWILKYAKMNTTTKQCKDLDKQLSVNGNVEIALVNCVKLSKMYNTLEIKEVKEVSYNYVFDSIEEFSCEYFSIKHEGRTTEAVTLSKEDFPVRIRGYQKDDSIEMRFGTKKINRWFIDRKIPRDKRLGWPVMVNASDEVILVPGIGCDIKHYSNNPTCFVVK